MLINDISAEQKTRWINQAKFIFDRHNNVQYRVSTESAYWFMEYMEKLICGPA
jgi:hypothetical protein